MSDLRHTIAQAALRVLGGATAFVLVFVAYAHLVTMHDAHVMLAAPRETHFTSTELLSRDFTADMRGGFSFDIASEMLHITGKSTAPDALAQFVGHDTRLVESHVRARFRWTSDAKLAFGVGLETTGDTKHAISFEMQRDGSTCTPRLVGDAHALGPLVLGSPFIAEGNSAPCDDQWHELDLRFCPDLMRVLGSVDGTVVVSPFASWDSGTLVRPTFGLRSLGNDQPAATDVSEVSWTPVPVDLSATDVDDAFNGKIIDPMWRVVRADPRVVDSAISTGAHGLEVTAHVLDHSNHAIAVELASPTAPLGSLMVTVDLDVVSLSHATIYFGIQNEPGPAWRFADVGVLSVGDGAIVPFESGHFDENGQGRFQAFPQAGRAAGKMSITLVYDAQTRRARASIDGRPFADEHVDLPPRSLARLRIGAALDDGGQAAFAIRRVRVDHAGK